MPGKTFPSSVCCARTGVTLQKNHPKGWFFCACVEGPPSMKAHRLGRERVARSRGCALASKRRCSRWLVSSLSLVDDCGGYQHLLGAEG